MKILPTKSGEQDFLVSILVWNFLRLFNFEVGFCSIFFLREPTFKVNLHL